MTTPFAHDDHSYTFVKRGSEVIPVRDDGAMPWSTYRSYTVKDGIAIPTIHAYSPALATQRECKQLIVTGKTESTSVHRIVWALTQYDAQRIREQEDIDAANRHPEPATPNP